MNRRDFLKKAAVVPAVVAIPALAKVPDRMPVPAAPEVVDAAWEKLLQDTPMTATEVLAAQEEMYLRNAEQYEREVAEAFAKRLDSLILKALL